MASELASKFANKLAKKIAVHQYAKVLGEPARSQAADLIAPEYAKIIQSELRWILSKLRERHIIKWNGGIECMACGLSGGDEGHKIDCLIAVLTPHPTSATPPRCG